MMENGKGQKGLNTLPPLDQSIGDIMYVVGDFLAGCLDTFLPSRFKGYVTHATIEVAFFV